MRHRAALSEATTAVRSLNEVVCPIVAQRVIRCERPLTRWRSKVPHAAEGSVPSEVRVPGATVLEGIVCTEEQRRRWLGLPNNYPKENPASRGVAPIAPEISFGPFCLRPTERLLLE